MPKKSYSQNIFPLHDDNTKNYAESFMFGNLNRFDQKFGMKWEDSVFDNDYDKLKIMLQPN